MLKQKVCKRIAILFLVVVSFCVLEIVSANNVLADESALISPEEKGVVEGVGKDFAITDSDYLNISLHSSEKMSLRLESIPKMIVIRIQASDENISSEIKIFGMDPDTTYHKYEDDYRNYAPILTDEDGAFSFEQDISKDHLIFIQPKKSTVIISNDATGGNCTSVGNWDTASKTCTLNKDVNETIQLGNDGIVLDGNGHKITGAGSGNGIYAYGKQNVIKNVIVSGFTWGIQMANGGSVTSSTISGNYYGIQVYGSKENILSANITNNTVSNNKTFGVYLYYTKNNNVSGNIVGPGNSTGLFQSLSDVNKYESNDFFSNRNGVVINGNYNILLKNTIHDNNTNNFYIESSDMTTNDVGTDNSIDGKSIYYEKNISDKIFDNSTNAGAFYFVNCQNITLKDVAVSEKGAQVVFWGTNNSLIEGLNSADESSAVALYYSSNNTIRKNIFSNIRVYKSSNNNKLYNNNIMTDDSGYTVVSNSVGNSFNEALPAGGNYWRSNERCKDANNDSICDSTYFFYGGSDNFPWVQKRDFNSPSGPSNVLFLPGLEASRLYKDGLIGNDELWIPTIFSNDIQQLILSDNGQSNESVFTDDIIESAGGNIYKTFADKLRALKSEGTINDFNLFAYDWRQSVEDIAQSGTPYAGGAMRSATLQAEALALTSKSNKVTIVAHSNGGLLAKAIMLELKKEGREDMVDKIVFVASPQMGTPRAITSMLFGYDEGLLSGLLASDAEMRTLAENMPGAYGLLPSEEYLKNIENPLIKFSSEQTRYKAFKDAYGEDISKDEYDQFIDFLLGKGDGREKPDSDDIKLENVLNEGLLQQAKDTHERLDAWTPPASMKVYEIAGWGLDTISGIEYKEKKGTVCDSYNAKVPSCTETDSFHEPFYDPIWTVDGDEVVVAPSALMLDESENVKKYWVDLWSYDDIFTIERNHKDILEVTDVDQVISEIITSNGNNIQLPENIKDHRPEPEGYDNQKPRLRMSLYSPLDIHLYADGKHTGPITIEENGQQFKTFEEQIPNSYYYQFGDRKYVGIPVGENVQIEMKGYGSGSYTLKIEEVKETENVEEVVAKTTFANLPVSTNTKVTLDIPESGLENMPNLKADYDGDGENDYEAAVVLGGEAQIIDNVKPGIEIISPEAKEYLNNQTINLAYSVMDNLSPQSDIVVQKYLDGSQIDSDKIDLSMLNLGNHAIKITATDKAGNAQEKDIIFSVTTSLQAIKDNVQKYYDVKLIKSKQQKSVLLVSLEIIEQRLEFLEMIKNNPCISQKAKNMIAMIVQKQIEQHVEFLLREINHKQKYYDLKIKQLLIEDFQWLENNAVK